MSIEVHKNVQIWIEIIDLGLNKKIFTIGPGNFKNYEILCFKDHRKIKLGFKLAQYSFSYDILGILMLRTNILH